MVAMDGFIRRIRNDGGGGESTGTPSREDRRGSGGRCRHRLPDGRTVSSRPLL